MFDEVRARFDVMFGEMMECRHRSTTPESVGLVERIGAAARFENRAAGAQLAAVGEVFAAGDIDFRVFTTLVFRTDLVVDAEVLVAVDAALAANVTRWPSMTPGRLTAQVDKIVAGADTDAVRRRRERQRDRQICFGPICGGLAEIAGSLLGPDAQALDRRLDALAATVCAQDPRRREQRRADALRALAAGADRLGCRCGRAQCTAAGQPAASPVVIHVIAEPASVAGRGTCRGRWWAPTGSSHPNWSPSWRPRPRWCRWSTPPTPHPSRAMCPPRRWPISCGVGM